MSVAFHTKRTRFTLVLTNRAVSGPKEKQLGPSNGQFIRDKVIILQAWLYYEWISVQLKAFMLFHATLTDYTTQDKDK